MRIEAYNQMAGLYKSSKSGKVSKSYDAVIGRDEVTISRAGYDYKVAQIKARVESGSYRVDAGDFASKLLEKYNALKG